MLPFHWKFGPLAITPNELFAVLGAAIAGWIIRKRLISLGTDSAGVLDFILAGLAGGAVGARLYYFLPLWFRGQVAAGVLFSKWADGSGFYGAFVGGAIAFAVTAKIKKMPVLRVEDAIMAVVPLGFAIGKIGCFLAGCCYGLPSSWGLKFPPGSLCYETQRRAGVAGTPVHPVPLYDLVFGFAFFGALTALQKKSRRPGEVFAACAAGYSIYRFFIEFLRDDPDCHTFGVSALRDSQIMAIAVLAAAGGFWAWLRSRKLPAETAPATPK